MHPHPTFAHFANTGHSRLHAARLSHLSPVDGLLQQRDHVLSLAARCLEAFGPLEEDALKTSHRSTEEDISGGLPRHPGGPAAPPVPNLTTKSYGPRNNHPSLPHVMEHLRGTRPVI